MKATLKTFLNPGNYHKNIDIILLMLRLAVGIFMLTHGAGKMLKLFGDEPIKFADPLGLGATTSLILIVFSEVVCSILLIVGLATRFAAIPLFISMLVVVFIVHGADGFGKQELPLLYSTAYLMLAIAGAGKISVDKIIYNKLNY